MPLYDFECPTCKRVFELLLKSSEEHPGRCPNCMNEKDLIRKVSAPGGFNLKGDGFYKPTKESE